VSDGFLFFCVDERRRAQLRADAATSLNGIDYLEVLDIDAPPGLRQRELRLRFVHTPQAPLTTIAPGNITVVGGERIPSVPVQSLGWAGDELRVRVAEPGDFSTYVLRLQAADGSVYPQLDPLLAEVTFSFKVECPSDFDCKEACTCEPAVFDEPEIDYLAKDYASFRQLMLDRMALVLPEWTERNAADVGITLVELLAYLGDYLSYRQDAVATEAYLGTAQHRGSVRRHARLLDYSVHDGCNARVWVQVGVQQVEATDSTSGIPLPEHTQLLTRLPGVPPVLVQGTRAYDDALAQGPPEFFETLHAATLFPQHDTLDFYAWGQRDCCLPAGATRATLTGDLPHLAVGDLLLFEEVLGPRTGDADDADPAHRHVVRLTAVRRPLTDPLTGDDLTEIEWGLDDRLPFALSVSATTDADHGTHYLPQVSIARGNVVLADHGRTLAPEALGAPPAPNPVLTPVAAGGGCADQEPTAPPPPRFRPTLARAPVTQAARVAATAVIDGRRQRLFLDPSAPAAAALAPGLERVLPVVRLEDDSGRGWLPQRDLLASDAFAPEFVLEVEDDGTASIRFGDDEYGMRPAEGVPFSATYRMGNGTRGNVGADSISHVALAAADAAIAPRIISARNPLPARGGVDPEPLEHVRQSAPAAFKVLQRAVTPADYVTIAERHPDVQRAQATVRWTGSWRTVFLSIDRLGGRPVDAAFRADLIDWLEAFRMAGHDVEINGPRFVFVELELTACVASGYFRSDVANALLRALGPGTLPDGRRGFFHPDNFTFGTPVYLSGIYAAAQAVEGVRWAEVTRLRRLGDASRSGTGGQLAIDRLEVARLDNDPNFPERGVLRLTLEGGR